MNELLQTIYDRTMTALRDLELEAIPRADSISRLPNLLQAELHLTQAAALLKSLLPED